MLDLLKKLWAWLQKFLKPQPEPEPPPPEPEPEPPTPEPEPEPEPEPSEGILYGYYYGDDDNKFRKLDVAQPNTPWATLHWSEPSAYCDSSDIGNVDKWRPGFVAAIKHAIKNERQLWVSINQSNHPESIIEPVLNILSKEGRWNHVFAIDIAGEPGFGKEKLEELAWFIRTQCDERSLGVPFLGVTLGQRQSLESSLVSAKGIDYIAVEAYFDPPGHEDPQENTNYVLDYLEDADASVPEDKDLIVIGQAYTRNGGIADPKLVIATHGPVVDWCLDNDRVLAICWFALHRLADPGHPDRPNGLAAISKHVPGVWELHKELAEDCT